MEKGKNFTCADNSTGINENKHKDIHEKILNYIKSGFNPTQIKERLNFSKQRINYYISTLKKQGCIKKISYGVWEYIKDYDFKKVKKTTRIGINQLEEVKENKEIRGHAFMIKLFLPGDFKNWENRRKIFDMLGLEWEKHYIGGTERGEISIIDNIKIHFYRKTIVFNFDEKDFISELAKKSKSQALVKFLKIVKKLERMFNNSPLSHYGKYKFRVIRQHYAIMKNALARQYINDKKKLECYTGKGLWLLIDDSFNLEELETVHNETAVEDNEKVQTVFNNIKEESIETLKEMSHSKIQKELVNLKGVFPAMKEYNENLKLHTAVQKAQLETQNETKLLLKEIREVLKEEMNNG